MAPNLSGDPDEDAASMPLGTLCIIDQNPRQSFGLEERRRLVYFAEAARREIEKWYLARMEVRRRPRFSRLGCSRKLTV